MIRTLYIASLLFLSQTLLAQVPDWVIGKGTSARFPATEYLTGLGIATVHKDSAQETIAAQAYSAAKRDLVEKVRVKVQASTESVKQQTDQEFSAVYASIVASTSDLEITGLQKQTYTDRRQKLYYVWVYARKRNVVDNYRTKYEQQRKKLNMLFAEAQDYGASRDKSKAEQRLLACRPVLSECAKTASVLRSLGQPPPATEDAVTARQVEKALEALVSGEAKSLSDLAYSLAYQLKQSHEQPLSKVIVSPLVYEQSQMASQFSQQFKPMLENELINYARWSTVALEDASFAGGNPNALYSVRGVYESLGDRLTISMYVKDIFAQEIIGMATATVPRQIVDEAQLSYIPQQFEIRQGEQQLFEVDEVLSHGIDLDAWTNKGREALTFTEGETMEIFYRVNIPCYVRFTYHLADGRRVHFFDRQVTEAEVDQVLRVPYDFVCDCTDAPCGVETLQMNAQETPLPELVTQERDGYAFVTENLESIIRKNRGNSGQDAPSPGDPSPGDPSPGDPSLGDPSLGDPEVPLANDYQAEKRLVITTMP